jgi:hypothetical protein
VNHVGLQPAHKIADLAATHASLRSIPDAVAQFAAMTGRTRTVMIKKRA